MIEVPSLVASSGLSSDMCKDFSKFGPSHFQSGGEQ